MLSPGGDRSPSAPHLHTYIPLGPNQRMSPITNHPLSYPCNGQTHTIRMAAQHQFFRAGSTRLTSFQNPWDSIHSDLRIISQETMLTIWMKKRTPWNQHPEHQTTPSRSPTGHPFTDHLTVVPTATRRGSSSGTGTSRPLSTRPHISNSSNSSSRILLRINDLWQSLRHHHQWNSSRLRSYRGGGGQTHGCLCEGVSASAHPNHQVAAIIRHFRRKKKNHKWGVHQTPFQRSTQCLWHLRWVLTTQYLLTPAQRRTTLLSSRPILTTTSPKLTLTW